MASLKDWEYSPPKNKEPEYRNQAKTDKVKVPNTIPQLIWYLCNNYSQKPPREIKLPKDHTKSTIITLDSML